MFTLLLEAALREPPKLLRDDCDCGCVTVVRVLLWREVLLRWPPNELLLREVPAELLVWRETLPDCVAPLRLPVVEREVLGRVPLPKELLRCCVPLFWPMLRLPCPMLRPY